MPKNHPIPHLSIVVPIGRDHAAFESTLISVLENQPEGSEVIVPHDGSYDDPFDLCEEVRFVESSSTSMVQLVAAAATHALGRFVNVLAEGVRATCGWADEPLDCFEHFDTGAVAPVIRSADHDKIVAAGWHDTSTRLMKSGSQGQATATESTVGAFLQASFWRRDVLRSLGRGFSGQDPLEASAVFHHLLRGAGWRTELALESTLICDGDQLPWEAGSLRRGMRLRAVRNHFTEGGWSRSLTASAISTCAAAIQPGLIGESIGQAFAPLAAQKVASMIHAEEVTACDDSGMIVTMPQRTAGSSMPLRRAA